MLTALLPTLHCSQPAEFSTGFQPDCSKDSLGSNSSWDSILEIQFSSCFQTDFVSKDSCFWLKSYEEFQGFPDVNIDLSFSDKEWFLLDTFLSKRMWTVVEIPQ